MQLLWKVKGGMSGASIAEPTAETNKQQVPFAQTQDRRIDSNEMTPGRSEEVRQDRNVV